MAEPSLLKRPQSLYIDGKWRAPAVPEPGQLDEVVEDRRRIRGPRALVELRDLLERRPQAVSVRTF